MLLWYLAVATADWTKMLFVARDDSARQEAAAEVASGEIAKSIMEVEGDFCYRI